MNKLLGMLVALQVLSIAAVEYNDSKIEGALPGAVTQGRDTFSVSQTQSLFSSVGTSLTMVNGWKNRTDPKACSVNLVYSDNGNPIRDYSGLLLDWNEPARRFTIADCRKLPERIFQPYIGG